MRAFNLKFAKIELPAGDELEEARVPYKNLTVQELKDQIRERGALRLDRAGSKKMDLVDLLVAEDIRAVKVAAAEEEDRFEHENRMAKIADIGPLLRERKEEQERLHREMVEVREKHDRTLATGKVAIAALQEKVAATAELEKKVEILGKIIEMQGILIKMLELGVRANINEVPARDL